MDTKGQAGTSETNYYSFLRLYKYSSTSTIIVEMYGLIGSRQPVPTLQPKIIIADDRSSLVLKYRIVPIGHLRTSTDIASTQVSEVWDKKERLSIWFRLLPPNRDPYPIKVILIAAHTPCSPHIFAEYSTRGLINPPSSYCLPYGTLVTLPIREGQELLFGLLCGFFFVLPSTPS